MAQLPLSTAIYQLRLVLSRISPMIWRRLLVSVMPASLNSINTFRFPLTGAGSTGIGSASMARIIQIRLVAIADNGQGPVHDIMSPQQMELKIDAIRAKRSIGSGRPLNSSSMSEWFRRRSTPSWP
jgi:hypothetical protein